MLENSMNVSVKDHGEKYATLLPRLLADVTISVRCLAAAVLPAQLVILILGLMKLLLCLQAVQKFGTRSRSFSGSLGFHVPDGGVHMQSTLVGRHASGVFSNLSR
jgi:hypothetical protein